MRGITTAVCLLLRMFSSSSYVLKRLVHVARTRAAKTTLPLEEEEIQIMNLLRSYAKSDERSVQFQNPLAKSTPDISSTAMSNPSSLSRIHPPAIRNNSSVTIRIAGGWVRDKLLGVSTKPDIDIAVDTMSGVDFARGFCNWTLRSSGLKIDMGVIQSNPDKSKHLETAAFNLGKYSFDIVNLRTENYSDSSRIPDVAIGTPREDAFRRDLTINSLFYNVNADEIEDFTGVGLQGLSQQLSASVTLYCSNIHPTLL